VILEKKEIKDVNSEVCNSYIIFIIIGGVNG
jgi:hypothetical protein